MDSGVGLGEEKAFRLAMLGDREVVEEVLRDCEDIVPHGERGCVWCLLAVGDDEHDVRVGQDSRPSSRRACEGPS